LGGALLERLKTLDHVTTDDADLHLIADGNRIEPIRLGAMRFIFLLPEGCANIHLMSRTFHALAVNQDGRLLGRKRCFDPTFRVRD
jgi:hypothetical protein